MKNEQRESKKEGSQAGSIRRLGLKVLPYLKKIKALPNKTFSILSALLVGVAIGLAPIWYNNYLNEPELVGRIITMTVGLGGIENSPFSNKILHTVFFSIANKRNTPVSVVDYELNLYFDNELKYACAPFYITVGKMNLGLYNFNGRISIPNNKKYLLFYTDTLITPAKPLTGYLMFDGGLKRNFVNNFNRAEIVLIDAYGKKHFISTYESEFRSVNLLEFLIPGLRILKNDSLSVNLTD